MRRSFALVLALLPACAHADDRTIITQHMQAMSDALVPGNTAPWNAYLDPQVIYAEEDGSYKGKAAILKEVSPLPKGLGGEIKVQLLSYSEDGDTAVALFRQHEIERYYGQTIHASYLVNTTWKKRGRDWKMIAAESLAERTDPPSLSQTPAALQKFAGTYRLKNSAPTYMLRVENGRLMGARSGRKAVEWKAETRDVYFIPGDNRIRKIFQYDAHGNVTGFIERRESWDIVWVKTS